MQQFEQSAAKLRETSEALSPDPKLIDRCRHASRDRALRARILGDPIELLRSRQMDIPPELTIEFFEPPSRELRISNRVPFILELTNCRTVWIRECDDSVLTWFFKNITSIRFRHWYGTLLLVLICFGMSARGQGAGTLASFQIGDRVRTISQSAIYLAPPFAGQFATTESIDVQGTITEGPVRSADIWWWKVRFDDGADGWLAERQIRDWN